MMMYIWMICVNENGCKERCGGVIQVMNGVMEENDERYRRMRVMRKENKIFSKGWGSWVK